MQDEAWTDKPWTDKPSGVHDYRASSCYAAGFTLRWELLDESEPPDPED